MHVTRVTPAAAETLTPRGAITAAFPQPGPARGPWPVWLETMLSRMAERRQLLALKERDLRDIGLTPAEAWALARKPLWRR
ncbi:DUF1127 domain-containing protein [Roseicella aerolata]|uniref:DUF1127 domain-containing protein n=1 Tax=Roseicella aerolata TaxID=2883479 RepID=A0A9X1ID05_9PROT|nr:DUF1127 domain-containing protein [Roseicella aerolata]MCB4822454.1 DUF1127 domain-containing protein [Roseicella aerolata]